MFVAAAQHSEDLVAQSTAALLAEVLSQSRDAVAAGEVRDLAEALALFAPLARRTPVPEQAA